MSMLKECLRKGVISFGDDFDNSKEVMGLFGKEVRRSPFRGGFKIPGRDSTIAWLVSDGKNGWTNIRELGSLTDDYWWNEIITISEYNDNGDITAKRIKEELENPLTRYVFWHEWRNGVSWHKFYGLFQIDKDATQATQRTARPCVVYRRTSPTGSCSKA